MTDASKPTPAVLIPSVPIPPVPMSSGPIPTEPPDAGNELDTLLGSLERARGFVAWKCGGLDAAGLSARLGPSAMTLGGLLKHLAQVENANFRGKLHNREPLAPWSTDDGEWPWSSPDGRSPSLRRLLVDMIEEYARHAGHADLIRESVDGLVGEDPPR